MRICWHSIYSPKLLYLGCTLKFGYCIYKLWVMIAWWLRGKFVNLGLISSFRFSLCLNISFVNECLIFNSPAIESIHSRGQHPCKFMGTKEIFYIRKESQLPQDLFKTPIWPPWRHVNTLYILTAGTDRVNGQQPVLRCKPRLYTPNRGRLSREDFFSASPTLKNLLRTKVVSRAANKNNLHLQLQPSFSISCTDDAATGGKSFTPGGSSSSQTLR